MTGRCVGDLVYLESCAILSSLCHSECVFQELPKEVQEAAKTLGYDKKMWDNDKEAETEDMDWDELSPAQQKAAEVLGYNQKVGGEFLEFCCILLFISS